MTAEPTAARLCRAWVRIYTRGLPAEVSDRRVAEIEADLWEHLQVDAQRARHEILGRTLRGIHADVWWRYRTLLDQRGARQGSQHMEPITTRRWWTPLALVLGIVMTTMGLLGLALGDAGDGSSAAQLAAALPPAVGGVLLLFGLATQRRRLVTGSRMVIAGAVLAALDPLFIPVSALIVIGGLWSGNLVATERDGPPGLEVTRQSMTIGWYRWLVASVVLVVVGFAVLLIWESSGVVPGSCDESASGCWQDSVAWLVWILSWLAAMVTGGIGLLLGALRYVSRHHTRTA